MGLNRDGQEHCLFSLAFSVAEEEEVAVHLQDLHQGPHPHLLQLIEFSSCLKRSVFSSARTFELVHNPHRDPPRPSGQTPCASFSLYSIQRSLQWLGILELPQ